MRGSGSSTQGKTPSATDLREVKDESPSLKIGDPNIERGPMYCRMT